MGCHRAQPTRLLFAAEIRTYTYVLSSAFKAHLIVKSRGNRRKTCFFAESFPSEDQTEGKEDGEREIREEDSGSRILEYLIILTSI